MANVGDGDRQLTDGADTSIKATVKEYTNSNPQAVVGVDATGDVITAAGTGINGGPVTVGTTQVEMTFTGVTRSIMIQSDPDNTGSIWVGLTGVTNAGGNAMVQLEPGDAIEIDLNDASAAIFAISDIVSQNVYKLALI